MCNIHCDEIIFSVLSRTKFPINISIKLVRPSALEALRIWSVAALVYISDKVSKLFKVLSLQREERKLERNLIRKNQ